MQKAFITGATGFLGRHLVDVLLENDWQVTAMVRSINDAKKILNQKVILVEGDLSEPLSVKAAMPDQLEAVFHTAADTSTWHKEAQRQEAVNIEGTRAILQAILDKDVGRLVHVSSIAVFGAHEGVITENTPRTGATSWVNYTMTKSFAERKVKEAVDRGMDAVVVNPTHIIGRYDNHNWARLILQMVDGSLPATPPGVGNFANGRAVAEGILAAFQKGKTGHNYILGGPKASFKEFLDIAADQIGSVQPPSVLAPFLLTAYAGWLSVLSMLSGKRPEVTREEAHMACETMDVCSDKAVAELGYKIIPLEESITESIAYLREIGNLPEK